MAKKITMTVDGQVFATKKSLTERCQKVLHGYDLMQAVSEIDLRFMTSLIERYHPEPDLKIGPGIKQMWPGPDGYGGKCLFLEREDGSTTDFSFTKCITKPSRWRDVSDACRNAVMDDVAEFRDLVFQAGDTVPCAITGELISRQTAHVDHTPPDTFEEILRRFLSQGGYDIAVIELEPTIDNKSGNWLVDEAFAALWRQFHLANAKLRIVSGRANLSDAKRQHFALRRQPQGE